MAVVGAVGAAGYASDPDRMRRFEHAVRALAALDRTNILVPPDVGTHEDGPYLVTKLLEGGASRSGSVGERCRREVQPRRVVVSWHHQNRCCLVTGCRKIDLPIQASVMAFLTCQTQLCKVAVDHVRRRSSLRPTLPLFVVAKGVVKPGQKRAALNRNLGVVTFTPVERTDQ